MNSNYWSERQRKYFENLEKDEAVLQAKLKEYYDSEAKKLDKEISSYYAQFGKDNVIEYKDLLETLDRKDTENLLKDMNTFFEEYPQYEHLRNIRENAYKIDRLESIQYTILKQQAQIAENEEEVLKNHLMAVGTNGYNNIRKEIGLPLIGPNTVMMKELINERWVKNENYSDRIWNNRAKVTEFLQNDFKNGVIRGDNYSKMGKILKDRFEKQSNFNIKRLVYTEGTFVQNQSMSRSFEDAGYISYFYDAVLDDRTTVECESLHGEEFLFADRVAGVNFPPLHSFCRSSFKVNTRNKRDLGIEDEETLDMGYKDTKEAFKSVRYTNIDKEYAKEIDKQFLDLQNKYPINKGNIQITARKAKSYLGQYSYGISTSKSKGVTYVSYNDVISISNVHHKTKEVSNKIHLSTYKRRGSPLRSDIATVDHEYGHAIDAYYGLMKNKDMMNLADKYRTKVQLHYGNMIDEINELNGFLGGGQSFLSEELYQDLRNELNLTPLEMNKKIEEELGDYAISDRKEFLAEGFATMRHLPEEEKTDFIQRFENLFNKKFNEVIRNATD